VYTRCRRLGSRGSGLLGGLILSSFTALLLVALRILITGNGQYTYTYPGGSEGGDYFLPSHATFCILIVAVDLVLATALARLSPSAARRGTMASARRCRPCST
jgi:hypothetical protein